MAPEIPATTSASQLVTYALCPRKYAFRYVYELPTEFTSTALLLGAAVHSAVAWWFEERLQGRRPRVARAQDILTADLTAGMAEATIRWKNTTPDALEAEARALLAFYLADHGELPVAEVEAPFELELKDPATGEVVGRPLTGYFDLVLENHTVVELKTSAKGWIAFDLIRHLQLGAYAFAANALHGAPASLEVHLVVRLKREPRFESYRLERAEPATRWWFEAARTIEAAIGDGHFPPTPSPLCRECEYEHACAAWTGQTPTLRRPRHRPALREAVLLVENP
jgi:putative RecB family exonuclease